MEEVDVLNFLFLLCSLELGAGYSSEELTLTQSSVLADMIAFGIVYRRKKKAKRFYPTRLATTLTSGKAPLLHMTDPEALGAILVETNFRVYAYTHSDLQIAILALFVHITTRFPNFVIGVMTQTMVQQAYRKGISSQQLIQYLKEHAHSQMRHQKHVLPPTVIDQLLLWELELQRLHFSPAKLIVEFPKQEEFDNLKLFATNIDALIWADEKSWKLVVKEEKYQIIVEHGRKMKEMRENLLLMKKKKANA
ncbi:RNA polymerase II transcription factor B 52 kDa subunit [Coelomomyces lativittatus]|nr:RNA polymerase II transcription factor B 52 kDa subunit [Coelomomyces lativittatus]